MSLLKVPFSALVIWAVQTTLTPPQPPAETQERVGAMGLEVAKIPRFIKTCFWVTGAFEIIVLIASAYPTHFLSAYILRNLVHFPQQEMRISGSFLAAWATSLSATLIRQRCYHVLGRMFTFELTIRKNHRLITSGPYAYVRHPSYSSGALALCAALACHLSPGSWLMQEGSALFSPEWVQRIVVSFWIITGVICYFVIAPRLKKEDDMLRKQFGDQWDQWAQKVPYKLIPWVY
ncbi:hypothetical protein NLJ89_g2989 [Agrocybe chaxingu]|uniref:Protein-S-isoprenylcysteine O-methyltransferase n=1 Tax=Agrocybe chaxingu TaxID=84603 RepID=A0A9W8MXP7_9AGAR|nr:hypothetical protein NLJ89_g2989 [Agrocybe chaxingu]